MNKKIFGFLLLLISLAMLFYDMKSNFTGNFIGSYFQENNLIHIFGFSLLFVSLILFLYRKNLDAVIIPTGPSINDGFERAHKTGEYYEKGSKIKYFVISGEGEKHSSEVQRDTIYRELRRHNIKSSKIKIEDKSHDTLENVIYSLKKLKNAKRIGIVSYPQHLNRFEYIIKKAKEEGIIDKNIKIEKIPTRQNVNEFFYGIIANLKERYRLRHGIKEADKNKTGKFGQFIKKLIN